MVYAQGNRVRLVGAISKPRTGTMLLACRATEGAPTTSATPGT